MRLYWDWDWVYPPTENILRLVIYSNTLPFSKQGSLIYISQYIYWDLYALLMSNLPVNFSHFLVSMHVGRYRKMSLWKEMMCL